MTLSPELTRIALVLQRASKLIAAVKSVVAGGGCETDIAPNEFTEAFRSLQNLSKEEEIPIALIGGTAAIAYGYERSTRDIDIVVSLSDFDRFITTACKYGIELVIRKDAGFYEVKYEDVPIDVIQEGAFSHNDNEPNAIPSPGHMGVNEGVGVASLPTWVQTKISRGRPLDFADIVEVFKKTKPQELEEVVSYFGTLNKSYLSRLQSLLAHAKSESVDMPKSPKSSKLTSDG